MAIFDVPDNLAFDSYQALLSAIEDWMDRSDLSGSIPQMVALAEARMRRVLEPLFLEASATVTVTEGLGDLPSDLSTLTRVIYDHDTLPRFSALNVSDLDYDESASKPNGYTMEGTQIRVWPSCDVTLSILYQPGLPQLSDSVTTNLILASHPDLYFFGAMLFAEGYVANDSRASGFKQFYDEALMEVREYLERQRYSGPLAPRLRREF